ncbi:MAG TPA: type II secretion system protein [Polyangiaceae bacterium]|jgi:general secretion pathway protein G
MKQRIYEIVWRAVQARSKGRARARGVTLVEVLIVVAIIALIAGGVAVFALPQFRKAQVKTAETAARTIRNAVHQWQALNAETSCPTVSQLIEEKQIDPGTETNDPWGSGYTITCPNDEVVVASMGPDRKKDTEDDIVIPKGASTEGE